MILFATHQFYGLISEPIFSTINFVSFFQNRIDPRRVPYSSFFSLTHSTSYPMNHIICCSYFGDFLKLGSSIHQDSQILSLLCLSSWRHQVCLPLPPFGLPFRPLRTILRMAPVKFSVVMITPWIYMLFVAGRFTQPLDLIRSHCFCFKNVKYWRALLLSSFVVSSGLIGSTTLQ